MKRLGFAVLVGFVVLAAVAPAVAQYNRPYYSSVMATGNQMSVSPVYSRYYVPGFGTISPSGGATTCPTSATGQTVSWNATLRACAMRYLAAGGGGYAGYQDNINKDGLNAEIHYGVHDFQTGSGTAGHIGYYFWSGRAVNNTGDPTSLFSGANCAGSLAATCIGQGNVSSSTGYGLINAGPIGVINPLGGLRPLPVPSITSTTPAGAINVMWPLDVKGWSLDLTEFGPAQYQIYGLAKAAVGNVCTPPTDLEYATPNAGDVAHVYPVQTGTTLVANVSDFGKATTDSFCYYFALQAVYDSADFNPPVASLYLSANSTGVVFGGLASSITNTSATINKGKVVTITWKTTLSECMQGYNVLRSFTKAGPYIKVNRTLIPDRHGPATYNYIDVLKTPEKQLWYEIEGIGCDQSVERTPAFEAKKK